MISTTTAAARIVMLTGSAISMLVLATTTSVAALEPIRVSGDGRSFILANSGKPFRPFGFNYDHDRSGRLIEDYWHDEWKSIEQDFQEMKQLGANVVRIHLQFAAFMESPDKPRQSSLKQLEQLLKLAERKELYLDLTGLGCYHKQDVPPWYDDLNESQRWKAQAAFWEAVALRCKQSPAVFCYDLMNEPVVPGDKPRTDWLAGAFAGKHFVQFITLSAAKRPRHEVARQWIRTLVAAIRKHDQRHLVTVGLVPWSLPRRGKLSSGFNPKEIAGELDFLAVHIYPEKGEIDEATEIIKAFAAVGKPVVIEETFPLKCGVDELGLFIDRVRPDVQGWISFYWGKTIKDYQAGSTIGDAVMAQWLVLFRTRAGPPHRSPYVLVLGTAQDGGLPQIACTCRYCRTARQDSRLARSIASLLVVDPRPDNSQRDDSSASEKRQAKHWLIDATPDIRVQHAMAQLHGAVQSPTAGRPPLFTGIFLTHAHTGHYLGLAQFGRPAYSAHGQPVFASTSMCDFLRRNGPWSLLVQSRNLVLHPLEPGKPIELGTGLAITPLSVPHRAEFTDTFGYVIQGPTKRLLYIPDIDKWERWDTSIEEQIREVDYALLDGTFFADGEVPGRKMSEIPHPFVVESLRRFASLPATERNKIWFTHLNHTNPLNDEQSPASRRVRQAGMHVAKDGLRFELSP